MFGSATLAASEAAMFSQAKWSCCMSNMTRVTKSIPPPWSSPICIARRLRQGWICEKLVCHAGRDSTWHLPLAKPSLSARRDRCCSSGAIHHHGHQHGGALDLFIGRGQRTLIGDSLHYPRRSSLRKPYSLTKETVSGLSLTIQIGQSVFEEDERPRQAIYQN